MMIVFPRFRLFKVPRPAFRLKGRPWVALLLGVAGWIGGAHAVTADKDEPLTFAADSARVEEAQKLNILSGNVEITKGTMVVRSDRVEIRQNPDGSQSASAFGGKGGKAYFRQQRDGLDEFIEGEAERVDYDGRADTVRFTGNAVMRRLRGTKVSDEVGGQVIVYDNKTSVFQVLGGAGSGGASSGGRVRGVITPRSAEASASKPVEGARP
ncbi:MAG: lipopolysaccharide transport periplasmic protein LptA [Burkholderiales bacterium]|nr:lipopolysaccharide transport periplasmic protein LptA [Burkholderiales bacterium]MDE2077969.1 lipopolysaccharide transport periplasmic protein LptA [Burkholderiales bacterium]MDE2432495.1 lipopolysaccharide transport periplasmic protein LptA [Burkholderiales bacterium]HET8695526.1 lipopolysaccharide transport periplasmic protein LptA [Aquabacterium sp.]